MANHRGTERGYAYRKSVHNIRIERLWCDVTRGFGAEWKDFFLGLEMHDGLDTNLGAHNLIRDERQRSPRDMFFFGMLQNDDEVGDFQKYGIDWEAFDEDHVRQHHKAANGVDETADNPFVVHPPQQLSDVQVPEANCPLTDAQIHDLDNQLTLLPHYSSYSMDSCRLLWIDALQICCNMFH
ncbi:hypothetical protein BDR03DRAFT_936647 [Suillus americanus]|nr:hypothetical protein BDR03DRAFT_936647 [Suillus americanus]